MALQLADLTFRDSSDKRQVVVLPALAIAMLSPPANITMCFRLGIEIAARTRFNGFLKTAADTSIVSRVVRGAIGLRFKACFGRNDMAELGQFLLPRRDQLRVKRKLQDRTALGLLGELRIDGFVRPCTKYAGRFHAAQHVRPSAPSAALECSLNNDRRAHLHRCEGPVHRTGVNADTANHTYFMPLRFEVFDVGLFVLRAPFGEKFKHWVPNERLCQLTAHDRQVERRQVAAIEMPYQIGSCDMDCLPAFSHTPKLVQPGRN